MTGTRCGGVDPPDGPPDEKQNPPVFGEGICCPAQSQCSPALKIRTQEAKSLFASHAADAAIVVAYGRLLPAEFSQRAFVTAASTSISLCCQVSRSRSSELGHR